MSELIGSRAAKHNKQTIVTGMLAFTMLLLFAFYANLRWANEYPAFEKAKETADTPSYIRISGEEILSTRIWANTRPPMFPLLLKINNADKIKVVAFHTAFSIFAWGMLALSFSLALKSLLRPLAFCLILALSLERHIAGWDVVMLTESLSTSFMALFIAAWLWLLRGWSWGKFVVLCLVAIAWAFTRDTNGWVLLMNAGLILLGVLFFGARKRYLAVAVVFVVIFALSNLSANIGHRWYFPFQNVLAKRILTDERALGFFADCGMPVTPKLLSLAGGDSLSDDRAFYTAPELEPYRLWMYDNGKSCYVRWLVSRPLQSLQEPWNDLEWLLAFEDIDFFYPQRYQPILPWYVERILYPQDALLWLWILVTVAALVAILKKAWGSNKAWLVFIGLVLLIYPHIFIVWHGDVPGTHRHALTIGLQFVLGFWMFWFLALEAVLKRFRVPYFV